MSNKVVIVTGASRGIGAAIARNLVFEHKCSVVLVARTKSLLENLCDEINSKSQTKSIFVAGDLKDAKFCQEIITTALQTYNKIDAVIHNAATIQPLQRLCNLTNFESFEEAIQINYTNVVRLTTLALPHVRKTKGTFVFVSSGAAMRGMTGWSAYCSTKAAINAFVRCLAKEEKDVRCVAVRPGVVETDMIQIVQQSKNEMDEEDYENIKQQQKLNPELPAASIAALAMHIPPALNGEFVSHDIAVQSK